MMFFLGQLSLRCGIEYGLLIVSICVVLCTVDTRETSFLYAIVGAGAVQAVVDACSQGRLLTCSCDAGSSFPHRRPPPGANHAWKTSRFLRKFLGFMFCNF